MFVLRIKLLKRPWLAEAGKAVGVEAVDSFSDVFRGLKRKTLMTFSPTWTTSGEDVGSGGFGMAGAVSVNDIHRVPHSFGCNWTLHLHNLAQLHGPQKLLRGAPVNG